MIERHIDYLQFQCSINQKDCIDNGFEQVTPVQFYRSGFRDAFGTRYYFGNNKSTKCLCIMAGTSLEKQRAWGKTDNEILSWGMGFDAKVSRLDLAITEWVESDLFLVEDVQAWYEQGIISSPLVEHGAQFISGYAEGARRQIQTFYIGSIKKRAKRGLLRCYDKGIELGLGEYLATRMELELRGENSQNSAKRLAECGSIAAVFRSKLDIKSKDFERLMDAPAVDISRGKGKFKSEKDDEMTKRFEWLMSQVAPAIKEFVEYDASQDINMLRVGQFLSASGLFSKTEEIAKAIASEKIRAILDSYELVPRGTRED